MKKKLPKMDLNNEGLLMIFPPYLKLTLETFWKEGGTWISREIWNHVTANFGKISRASVINGLNWLVDLGICGYEEESGKGGYHRVYHAKMNEQEFWKWISEIISKKIADASGLHAFI